MSLITGSTISTALASLFLFGVLALFLLAILFPGPGGGKEDEE